MRPKIKSIPYEEWNDNASLEKIVDELHEGGVNGESRAKQGKGK